MISIIIGAVIGLIIGITAGDKKNDEPIYIQMGGIVVAVLITYPIQLAIRIFI